MSHGDGYFKLETNVPTIALEKKKMVLSERDMVVQFIFLNMVGTIVEPNFLIQ